MGVRGREDLKVDFNIFGLDVTDYNFGLEKSDMITWAAVLKTDGRRMRMRAEGPFRSLL